MSLIEKGINFAPPRIAEILMELLVQKRPREERLFSTACCNAFDLDSWWAMKRRFNHFSFYTML